MAYMKQWHRDSVLFPHDVEALLMPADSKERYCQDNADCIWLQQYSEPVFEKLDALEGIYTKHSSRQKSLPLKEVFTFLLKKLQDSFK